MAATLTALREEHKELLPRIEQIKQAADLIELASVEALIMEIEESHMFLTHHLLPHAQAEEDVLYRAYDQVAQSPWATDTMRRDHAAIMELADELIGQRLLLFTDAPTVEQKHELRRILYGLYTLIRQHFRQEEELILPRIEAGMTQEAADQMMESLEKAAATHRPA
jgi:hypothetical protein